MTPAQQQEEVSKAYLHAVAAKCGFTVASWTQDHGGIDCTIGAASTVGIGHLARPKIDVQLKATCRTDVDRAEFVSWPLDMAHYDGLRAPAHAPHLLVVLLLGTDVDRSIEHTVEQLVLRRCAYWVKMTGMESRDGQSVRVRLPKSNVFSPAGLRAIMERVSRRAF
jgi:hypothetical protein